MTPAPVPRPARLPATRRQALLRTAAMRGANGHSASGSARIMKEGDSFVLELGDDFRIDSGNNDVMPHAPA